MDLQNIENIEGDFHEKVNPCVDPSGWVNDNFNIIRGWVKKNYKASYESEDLKQDAYVAAICSANIMAEKEREAISDDGIRFFRATFFNMLKQTIFIPRISTTPFSSMVEDDDPYHERDYDPPIPATSIEDLATQVAADAIELFWDELAAKLKDHEKNALEVMMGLTHRGVISCREAEGLVGRKKSSIAESTASGIKKIVNTTKGHKGVVKFIKKVVE